MNFSTTILKGIMLSTCTFWLITASESFEIDMIPFVFLSIIPISICCSITILFTIMPFFWLNKSSISNVAIYKKYFPFYALVSFGLCFYGVLDSGFNIYPMSFFASAFFTTMQSWVWLVNDNKETKILIE